jgi:hypothetical protein
VSAGEKRQITASTGIRTQISRSSSISDRLRDWTHSNQAERFQVVGAGDVGWLYDVVRDFMGFSLLVDAKRLFLIFKKLLTTLFLDKVTHLHSKQIIGKIGSYEKK